MKQVNHRVVTLLLLVMSWASYASAQGIRIWKDGAYQEFRLTQIDSIQFYQASQPVAATSITLDRTELQLNVGQKIKLVATVHPEDATDKEITWVSSNKAVVTVTQDGEVQAIKDGTARILAKAVNGTATKGICQVTVSSYEAVDLGLPSGTKWANMNLGARSINGSGFYYAWGESNSKSSYTEDGYADTSQLSALNATNDAATLLWGSQWSTPTEMQMRELMSQCTWRWTLSDGVYGYKVTGQNGNYIFLPCTGYYDDSTLYRQENMGYYWLATGSRGGSQWAYNLHFGPSGHSVFGSCRFSGYNIRAVCQ